MMIAQQSPANIPFSVTSPEKRDSRPARKKPATWPYKVSGMRILFARLGRNTITLRRLTTQPVAHIVAT